MGNQSAFEFICSRLPRLLPVTQSNNRTFADPKLTAAASSFSAQLTVRSDPKPGDLAPGLPQVMKPRPPQGLVPTRMAPDPQTAKFTMRRTSNINVGKLPFGRGCVILSNKTSADRKIDDSRGRLNLRCTRRILCILNCEMFSWTVLRN